MQIIRLLFPTIFTMFITFSSIVYASNECTTTNHTGIVSSTNNTYTNTDTVFWNSSWNRKRYYIKVAEPGTVNISIVDNTKPGDSRFNASVDSCPDYQGASKSWSHTFNSAGDFNIDVTPWSQTGNQSYTLNITFISSSPLAAFKKRYTNNLKGNIKVIGNTILSSRDGYDKANNKVRLEYIDIDTIDTTFNSSSATIDSNEAGVDISNARIKWAGLYWQGYLHSDDDDAGIDSQYTISSTQSTAHTQIQNIINTHTVLLTKGTGTPMEIKPDQLNWDIQYDEEDYVSYKYGAFANVTSLLQNQPAQGQYTVANIPTREGQTDDGDHYDALGNYGAWSLVIVYDNNTSVLEKTRNVTVFDGYLVLNSNTTQVDIPVDGFKTPKNAPNGVDSTLSVFAAEGDKFITGDHLELIGEDTTNYRLSSSDGDDNFFNSSVEGVDNRNPILSNNMGIDIHTQAVGTSNGNDKPIKTNNTRATIRIGTDGDHFVPSMVAFATELFTPKLCYDYDVRIGEYVKVNSENREIKANKRGTTPLTLTLLIRSELSDFPIDDTTVNVTFSPSTLDYVSSSSKVSPPDTNIYVPIGDINSALGKVGIGRGATSSSGGTIGALESTYIKQDFSFVDNAFDGTFDIHVQGTILFDPNALPVPYTLSTNAPSNSPNYIRRCNTNPVYDPIWSNFNIERSDSTGSQPDEIRYPLYTQIAGKDFNISIVSYTNTGPSGKYDVELDTNATVELELINASFFDNNSSAGYDSTCEEPAAVGDGAFISFADEDGTLQSRVQVRVPQDLPNFNNDIALQSAAFRLWVLTTREANGTKSIVKHACTLSGDCFRDLYQSRIKSYDLIAGNCQTACETNYTAQGCYQCLREYFATPICSRDNFSIRPESFRVNLSDNNETNTTNKIFLTDNRSASPKQALAAQYKYAIDINATLFNQSANAKGYYNDIFEAQTGLSTLGDKTKRNVIAALEFKDSSSCTDTSHRSYDISFTDGKSSEFTYISHDNVGDYNFWMLDSNWTNVDQANYPYKARFGTCVKGDTRAICSDCDNTNPSSSSHVNGKLGCVINSNLKDNTDYTELPLRFEPYAFSLSNILMSLPSYATPPPNGQEYVYIHDDLENPICRNMSTTFQGTLSAIGKKDTNLSNYTDSCAAKDVTFDINTSMTQEGLAVSSSNIKTVETVPQTVYFKKNYIDSNNNSHPLDNNESNVSSPIIIRASEFKNDANGTAPLKVLYNFARYENAPVNPINVTFIAKEANATDASSSAHLQTNYVPKRTAPINSNIDFVYGRIVSSEPEYIVPRSQTSTIANLYPEVYCDFVGTACNNLHNLATASLRDPDVWKIHTIHSALSANNDIDRITDPKNKLTIAPNANVNLSSTGSPTPINISIPLSVRRTYSTTLNINPGTCSWFDDTSIDTTFLGGGGWAGPGKTGLVLESNASHDQYNKRTEW